MNIPGFTAENSLYQAVAYYPAQNLNAAGKGDLFGSTRVFASQVRHWFEVDWGGGGWSGGRGGGGGGGGFPVINNSEFCKMNRLLCLKRCSAFPSSAKTARAACREACAEIYSGCRGK